MTEVAAAGVTPARSAAWTTAPASTWNEYSSTPAASASSPSVVRPGARRIATTSGAPPVTVPVLSMVSAPARPSSSSAAPPLTTTPDRDARDIPPVTAIGTASNNGHGVAVTSTATARVGSPVTSHATAAISSAAGRNQAATRSASRATGAVAAAACSASRTTPE